MIKEETRFTDSTLFEGMISISAVLNSNASDRKIKKVLFDRQLKEKKAKEYGYLKKMSSLHGFELSLVDTEQIDAVTTGSSHGGIIAYCTDRTLPVLDECNIRRDGFYVYIEGIEDPYNFGYCVRSLYAAGVDGLVLSPRNWLSAAGVVCRASAGASELMPIYCDTDGTCASLFHSLGYRIVCADTKNAVDINDAELEFPIFLIIGGERRGISKQLLSQADVICRIEYGREFHQALSAASASAVLAFEILRKNRNKR